MILVDTSVWISVFRDQSGEIVAAFRKKVGSDLVVLSRFNQLELLQGAKDLREWQMLEDYLATQIYLEASADTWRESARIYFDLRRKGSTVSSPVDCCIAQIALESGALLLHCDRDFELIGKVRSLNQEYFQLR
jgi:predicted nucleic acid-binding protein